MAGQRESEWPQYPFCSPRCKLVDLGRWLGENYRIPEENDESTPDPNDIASESP
jgi:endogenous inhibitor of DNA gyrase (YacG/DUF329 family)